MPRVIGKTAIAGITKGVSERGERWDSKRFFDTLEAKASPDDRALAQGLMDFGQEITGRSIEWGSGKERGSFTARLILGTDKFSLFSVYTTGEFSLNLGWNRATGEELSEKYRQLAKDALGLAFDGRTWSNGWPIAPLSALSSGSIEKFKELIREFAKDVRIRAEERV